MQVPFYDLGSFNARFESEFAAAQTRVLRSGRVLLGAEVREFEREFAAFTGTSFCVCVANGLDALRLVLMAWISLGRLAKGDEVVVPSNSFIASALAVTQAGLDIRLADVDPATYNVTAATVLRAVTGRTRVVMPVHLFGRLADAAVLADLCRAREFLLLEDAAQAHGARSGGVHAGAFGDAGAFSFYPAKNLGALGDAGCVVTNDPVLTDCVRMLGNYGSRQKYEHLALGANSRTDELQAAFLRVKLRALERDNARRREIATRYVTQIAHPAVVLPQVPPEPASHVWHLFVVTTPNRAALVRHLETRGVQTMIHYPHAIHRQPAYVALARFAETLPTCERLQNQVLSLPVSPVMSDEQVSHVINAVNDWIG